MTAETSGSVERARRANEFAKPKHPGIGANLPDGARFTTIEVKTNFLGTVREDGAIRGRAASERGPMPAGSDFRPPRAPLLRHLA
jgi:hypothetical protein